MTELVRKQSVADHKVGAGMVLVSLIAAILFARKRLERN